MVIVEFERLDMEQEFYEDARRIYEDDAIYAGKNMRIAKRLQNGTEYVLDVYFSDYSRRINCKMVMYEPNGQFYKTYEGPLHEFMNAAAASLRHHGYMVAAYRPRREDIPDWDYDTFGELPKKTPEGYGEW